MSYIPLAAKTLSDFLALRRVMPITKLKMKWSMDALRLKGGLTRAAAEV